MHVIYYPMSESSTSEMHKKKVTVVVSVTVVVIVIAAIVVICVLVIKPKLSSGLTNVTNNKSRLPKFGDYNPDQPLEDIDSTTIPEEHAKSNTVILDVGSNNGDFSFDVATKNPEITVYAFEPNPDMVQVIEDGIQQRGLNNVVVVQAAVSDYNGESKFYLDDLGDKGCSSLKKFQANVETTWKGRNDLKMTRETIVKVIRLDDFMKENGIKKIQYLHIDAQGTDLQVLKGLGKRMNDVLQGDAEAANNHNVALYANQHTKRDIISYVKNFGFKITRIQPSDCKGNWVKEDGCNIDDANEVIVYFSKKST